ncbi:hypothetical protein Hte_005878 [Hypoxylon texense]
MAPNVEMGASGTTRRTRRTRGDDALLDTVADPEKIMRRSKRSKRKVGLLTEDATASGSTQSSETMNLGNDGHMAEAIQEQEGVDDHMVESEMERRPHPKTPDRIQDTGVGGGASDDSGPENWAPTPKYSGPSGSGSAVWDGTVTNPLTEGQADTIDHPGRDTNAGSQQAPGSLTYGSIDPVLPNTDVGNSVSNAGKGPIIPTTSDRTSEQKQQQQGKSRSRLAKDVKVAKRVKTRTSQRDRLAAIRQPFCILDHTNGEQAKLMSKNPREYVIFSSTKGRWGPFSQSATGYGFRQKHSVPSFAKNKEDEKYKEVLHYRTAEHYFHEQKARWYGVRAQAPGDTNSKIVENIRKASTPKEARDLGGQIKGLLTAEWDKNSNMVALMANAAKFKEEGLTHLLLSSCGKTIVEASPNDAVWGNGRSHQQTKADIRKGDFSQWGANRLGVVLMTVREALAKKVREEYLHKESSALGDDSSEEESNCEEDSSDSDEDDDSDEGSDDSEEGSDNSDEGSDNGDDGGSGGEKSGDKA